jgi:hypothetical protein
MNHHGNTKEGGVAGVEWIVPGLGWNEPKIIENHPKCVARIRYNTSSRDFDGWDSKTWPDGFKGTFKIEKLKCSKMCTILVCNYRKYYSYSFIPLLMSSL